jgi:FAD/FMN-containing dehydrogenase/Fe-S oxidoreductase
MSVSRIPLPQVAAPRPVSPSLDVRELAATLRRRVRGEVGFDGGSRALYATDASNYRQLPIGVVKPRDEADLVEAVAVCRQFDVPVLPRGGGTSLAGQGCNVAVVLDCSKYLNHLLELDPECRRARVQPGTVLDDLRRAAEPHYLTFGPDPATHAWCTVGGMIGNNSCGVHSVMAGETMDNVEELEVLTYDGLRLRVGRTSEEDLARIIREGGRRGEIYGRLQALRDRYADQIRARFPQIPRRVSGYNLEQLLPEFGFQVARALVGTEGTCVTVLGATLLLTYSPPARTLVILGYPDVFRAADHIPFIMAHHPIGVEGLGEEVIADERRAKIDAEAQSLLPEGGGWLLVEFGGEHALDAEGQARAFMAALSREPGAPAMRLVERKEDQALAWRVREDAEGSSAHAPGQPDRWVGWDDSAVPPDRLGGYLRDLRQLLDRYGYQMAMYGHFGQGCVHGRISFDLISEPGIRAFRSFLDEAADLVVRYGGSLSGEHGDGQARAALWPKMFGDDLVRAFGEFKAIWDPTNRMNPGKLVSPNPIVSDLRLGASYQPPPLTTYFQYPADHGSFAQATLRCIGVGKCRRMDTGLMCPSYLVTHEEKDTTRGRAHLLFEMLNGREIRDGWRSEAVKSSLDLCLACKGCKGECPVRVDLATYKAEFLAHYYQGRLRPPAAYAFGYLHRWAHLASYAPGLANLLTRTPGLSVLGKRFLGIAPERQLPPFPPHTFKDWFQRRGPRNLGGPPVILWADTFTNYFQPQIARAAVRVLEAAGCQVWVPMGDLCCGRPVYDFGLLDHGKHLLRVILATLRHPIREGVPLVGLEPSCVSVFRDELIGLFPHDEDAQRLAHQSFLLEEFLEQPAARATLTDKLPRLKRRALVQMHCHHQAIMRTGAERAVLDRLGLDYTMFESGCCGMAGAFGFEAPTYPVSMQIAERVLLPAVRAAPPDTLLIADGFSCREQITQSTGRHALHLAEVLALALRQRSG